MTTRRRFLGAALSSALLGTPLRAQPRMRRVGMLGVLPRDRSIVAPLLIRALADAGYREGREIALEYRVGADVRAIPAAKELVALDCELFFAFEELAVRTLRQYTSAPMVFFAADFDPIETQVVKDPRRPEGNMTGVYGPLRELTAKKLELAQEVLPGARRFLAFADVHSRAQLRALQAAARARAVQLTVIEYSQPPYDLAAGFEAGRKAGVEAFIGFSSPQFAAKREELAELFVKYRIPVVAARQSYSHPGFLIGYSHDLAKALRRTAQMGAQILQGAKVSEIPVEQAHEFEMVVNLKTAKALGVKIPASVMARATRVIE